MIAAVVTEDASVAEKEELLLPLPVLPLLEPVMWEVTQSAGDPNERTLKEAPTGSAHWDEKDWVNVESHGAVALALGSDANVKDSSAKARIFRAPAISGGRTS